MHIDLSEQTVLITGASRGIGREIAVQMAAAGATVGVHYNRNQSAARETVAQLAGDGHLVLQADLSRPQNAAELMNTAVAELGRVDILVNNAGVFYDHPVADIDLDGWRQAWRDILNVNLISVADLMYTFAHHRRELGRGGKIINISSRGAFRGEPTAPAYGAGKAGLNALGQSLAKALAPEKIFVYTIAPGFVETDMAAHVLDTPAGDEIRAQSPMNRVARPSEIARTAVFLAGPDIDFLTGSIIDVNGASYLRT